MTDTDVAGTVSSPLANDLIKLLRHVASSTSFPTPTRDEAGRLLRETEAALTHKQDVGEPAKTVTYVVTLQTQAVFEQNVKVTVSDDATLGDVERAAYAEIARMYREDEIDYGNLGDYEVVGDVDGDWSIVDKREIRTPPPGPK